MNLEDIKWNIRKNTGLEVTNKQIVLATVLLFSVLVLITLVALKNDPIKMNMTDIDEDLPSVAVPNAMPINAE